MKCFKKVQIGDKVYTANTDFRIAIKCNQIAQDETIDDYERVLGIICTVFGEEGYNNKEHHELLLKWILKYLSCGQEIEDTNEEPDMDYIEDMPYIEASFMSDYNIDLENIEMDWQKFNTLMNGLSNSDMGNCCVLNRVRNLRKCDTKKISDPEERQKIEKAKRQVALKKKRNHKQKQFTDEEIKNMEEFNRLINSK